MGERVSFRLKVVIKAVLNALVYVFWGREKNEEEEERPARPPRKKKEPKP